jgi:hypothetical protein
VPAADEELDDEADDEEADEEAAGGEDADGRDEEEFLGGSDEEEFVGDSAAEEQDEHVEGADGERDDDEGGDAIRGLTGRAEGMAAGEYRLQRRSGEREQQVDTQDEDMEDLFNL